MTDPFTDAPIAPQGDIPLRNGLGTAALVLGMVAIPLIWLPVLRNFAPLIALLAVIFGAIGLARAHTGLATNRGAAAGGFFSGLAVIIVSVLVVLIIMDPLALF